MKDLMSWIDFWNRRVQKMNIWDLQLAQVWTAAWVLLFAKIFPQIMQVSIGWFVLVMVLCLPWLVRLVFFRP